MDEVLLGELQKRRAEVLEMLKLVPDDERSLGILRKLDEEIENAWKGRMTKLAKEWRAGKD